MTTEVQYTLPQLQNLIKRDPQGYRSDFLVRYVQFKAKLAALQSTPAVFCKDTEDLLLFVSHVSHCFKDLLADFPGHLHNFVKKHATALNPCMRMSTVKALILLRNKGLLAPTTMLELCFFLFKCQDKALRKMLYNYIVSDIKNINTKRKEVTVNTTLQNYVYTMLQDQNKWAAKMSLDVMIELYRRNIWRNEKTVNVIKTACFSKETKVLVAAVRFFLGENKTDDNEDSDSGDDDDAPKKTSKELQLSHRVGKKTQKRKKKLERAMQRLKKNKKKRKQAEAFDYAALRMVHDPQSFCERLFQMLRGTTNKKNSTTTVMAWEVKMLLMDLISRLIGAHELILCEFYPYIKPRLVPRQEGVTKLLLFVSQASHELVPPDSLEEIILAIANNFITERNSSDVMAVGLNAVREICARCPLAMSKDLLSDLVLYKNHGDKAVMMAARALMHVYRAYDSQMLSKKHRGRPVEEVISEVGKSKTYGEKAAPDYVPGTEFLPDLQPDAQPDSQPNPQPNPAQEVQAPDEWEECSDDEDDSEGEWIDVHHSSDEEEAKAKEPETAEDKAARLERAKDVSSQRILTQEEFQAMQRAQAAHQVALAPRGRKRKHVEISSEAGDRAGLPSLGDIENVHKRKAHDRESRLATVRAGQEDRPKYSRSHEKKNPHASTTNKQKKKNKNFMMVKHKVAKKTKRSFRDKQIALRKSLLKRAKAGKR